MGINTLSKDIIWYTCPVCTETYDIDCWENRSTCVCCGAEFSEDAKNTEQQVQPDLASRLRRSSKCYVDASPCTAQAHYMDEPRKERRQFMAGKCIVFGCTNKKHQGGFVGDICVPCYKIITDGDLKQPSTNFIHKLAQENERLRNITTAST